MRSIRFFLGTALLALGLLQAVAASAQNVATQFALSSAARVRFDHSGNLFIARRVGSTIYKVPAGSTTPVLFASGFTDPLGLGIDSHNNLYVANYQGAIVQKVTPAGAVSTFANGFSFASCVAVDGQDNVYVGEFATEDVFKITPGGVVTPYGNANLQPAPGGPSPQSHLMAIAFDPSGKLWCGTYGPSGSTGPYALSTIPAGGGTGVQLPRVANATVDLAWSQNGYFYAAGYQTNQLSILALDGTQTDYAGTGIAGLVNGPIATCRFNWPSGIAVDDCGNLSVADWNNNVVRQVVVNAPCLASPVESSTWGRLKAIYR